MKHTSATPKTLTAEEQGKLLRETERNPEDLRDHILFALALGTGLRVSELVALNVGDVKNGKGAKGLIELRPETTKGGRGGCVALPERLRRKVSRYLRWKEDRGEALLPEAPLFCSRAVVAPRHGQVVACPSVLPRRSSRRGRRGWALTGGAASTCSAIRLPRISGTRPATSGLVQAAARHASPTVTAIYTVPTTQDLVDGVQGLPC